MKFSAVLKYFKKLTKWNFCRSTKLKRIELLCRWGDRRVRKERRGEENNSKWPVGLPPEFTSLLGALLLGVGNASAVYTTLPSIEKRCTRMIYSGLFIQLALSVGSIRKAQEDAESRFFFKPKDNERCGPVLPGMEDEFCVLVTTHEWLMNLFYQVLLHSPPRCNLNLCKEEGKGKL